MNPYDYTDKQLAPVRESLIRLFGKLKTAKSESLLDLIKRIYKELKSKVDKMYLKIVRYYYKKTVALTWTSSMTSGYTNFSLNSTLLRDTSSATNGKENCTANMKQ